LTGATGATGPTGATGAAGSAAAITYVYTATAGQTTFSGADLNSLTLAYTVGAEQVYLNGVLLVRVTDYTASTGTSIVLASGAIVGDSLAVVAYGTFLVANTYTQAEANARYPLNTTALFAGKNKIINGDFGVWQRGTGPFTTAGGYNADRWRVDVDAGTFSASRSTFTPGTAPVAGYEGTFFLTVAMTTGGNAQYISQLIEDVRTFAGQTMTISFWAKANTSISSTPIIFQNFGSGGSSQVNTSGTAMSLTTSWTRFTQTFTVPSISGKTVGTSSHLGVQFIRTSTASTVDIWGVQVEAGSVATAFQTATGTTQGELAACQRYYTRFNSTNGLPYANYGAFLSTTIFETVYNLPVEMRVTPTALDYSNAFAFDITSGASYNSGTFGLFAGNPKIGEVRYTHGSAAFTTGRVGYFYPSPSGFIGFSAEL
jgi:hypothetical protein